MQRPYTPKYIGRYEDNGRTVGCVLASYRRGRNTK